jgi:LuxR family maltose regulon positive regulatory protein
VPHGVDTPVFPLTKIRPPKARAGLIARTRLERRLGEALAGRRLTLLSAPAGFGKTAALARQLELLPQGTAVAWIAGDDDDDLHRFISCLFAALEPFDLPWRQQPDALVAAAADPAEGALRRVADELLNALAACEVARGLIVLDDADRIRDTRVFGFIDMLLERLPEQWGCVVCSRVDPPLALARLRAQDELTELRQTDLAFVPDEVRELIAEAGSAADGEQLMARTAGWPAGVRMLLRAGGLPPQAGRLMDRHLFDFLASEVLDHMPVELREFLLHCAVLPELTAARRAHVAGNPRAERLLEEIERRGLFVTVLDAPELTLRLHDLLRDFLEDRLRRERPEMLAPLLRRAAETESDPIRRLSLLMRAFAWQEAEELLEGVAEDLLAAGAADSVARLVEQFPPERQRASPVLALVRGRVAWARWNWPLMTAELQRAGAGFAAAGDERRRQRAQALEAMAYCGRGMLEPCHRSRSSQRPALQQIVCRASAAVAAVDQHDAVHRPLDRRQRDRRQRAAHVAKHGQMRHETGVSARAHAGAAQGGLERAPQRVERFRRALGAEPADGAETSRALQRQHEARHPERRQRAAHVGQQRVRPAVEIAEVLQRDVVARGVDRVSAGRVFPLQAFDRGADRAAHRRIGPQREEQAMDFAGAAEQIALHAQRARCRRCSTSPASCCACTRSTTGASFDRSSGE